MNFVETAKKIRTEIVDNFDIVAPEADQTYASRRQVDFLSRNICCGSSNSCQGLFVAELVRDELLKILVDSRLQRILHRIAKYKQGTWMTIDV